MTKCIAISLKHEKHIKYYYLFIMINIIKHVIFLKLLILIYIVIVSIRHEGCSNINKVLILKLDFLKKKRPITIINVTRRRLYNNTCYSCNVIAIGVVLS